MEIFSTLLVLIAALTIIFVYLTWSYNFWKKQGVHYVTGPIPGVGHLLPVLFLVENLSMMADRFYKTMSGKSMLGCFFMRTPALIVRDPEVVKSVLVTNFASFQDNAIHLKDDLDPLLVKDPFFARGDSWKESRTRFVNLFSGKKLRLLFGIIQKVSSKLDNYLDRKIMQKNGVFEEELKLLMGKFTGEVSANAGYGIEGESFEDNPRPESFYAMIHKVFAPTIMTGIQQGIRYFYPDLGDVLGTRLMPKEVDTFFRDTVKMVMEQRSKDNAGNDILQFTIDSLNKYDEELVAAQLASFFLENYETSSTVASFTVYELSINPDVQAKARREVLSVLEKHKGEMSYESLKEMVYLEQVINEAMRFHPVVGAFMKICTKDCTLHGSDGQSCRVNAGNMIIIPVKGLQMDKEYWPEPETFDPERFAADRKLDITKFTYLPFGEGPRICLGMRLGIMQLKSLLATILRKYQLEFSPKTKVPLKPDPNALLTTVKGGIWARFKHFN